MGNDRTEDPLEIAVRERLAARFESNIEDLSALVRIPSVSWPAFDPAHVAQSAEAIAAMLREIGIFDVVDVRRAPIEGGTELGQPAVVLAGSDLAQVHAADRAVDDREVIGLPGPVVKEGQRFILHRIASQSEV